MNVHISMTKWDRFLHYNLFIGLAIVAAALPLSNFFMSVGTLWISAVCILRLVTDVVTKKNPAQRFRRLASNRPALLLITLYILVVAGMAWTTDTSHGAWDLRMKLPLFALPVAMLLNDPPSARWIRMIKGIFIISISFAICYCLFIMAGLYGKANYDPREISVFISHIRFSLLIVLAMVIALHETWNMKLTGKVFSRLICVLCTCFLFVLESVTGFAVLGCVIVGYLLHIMFRKGSRIVRLGALAFVIILPLSIGAYIYKCYKDYFNVQPVTWNTLPSHTPYGDVYVHYAEYPLIEEGHYAMTHVAWSELYGTWSQRSKIHPDSADQRGHQLKGTLMRYLSSKGLAKDRDGILSLTEADVRNIEAGYTSVNEPLKNPLRKRIDNILFEYANFRAGGTPNGHSVLQRIEFWRAAMGIIREHPLSGVGTGDTKAAFHDQYEKMDSSLDNRNRLRAHNQYLTMWLTYGLSGLLILLAVILLPAFTQGKYDLLYMAFLIIAAVSFLTEDTLESQAGVMFFGFFYTFLHPQYSGEKSGSLRT